MTKATLLLVSLAFLSVTNLVAGNARGQECGDVNGAGGITATDALIVLKKAVGADVPPLVCPVVTGVPVTGQTSCYSLEGSAINCAGTGQDGEMQAGVPRSFTDNADGTITDNSTGLMWEKLSNDDSLHDVDAVYTWDNGFAVKIATLNSTNFAGHNDWRLPNRFELESLVTAGTVHPATYPAFDTACAPGCTVFDCSCTAPDFYWSATSAVAYPQNAWYVLFNGGYVAESYKGNVLRVRAVRGGLPAVITDSYTGVQVPGSFALRRGNVDPSTITVSVRSPLPPFDLVRLIENVHYQRVPYLLTWEIQVIALPSGFSVPGTYDFVVSYSLLSNSECATP